MEIPPGADPNGIVLTFPVPVEQAGQRLDRFLQTQIPRLSRTRAQQIVRACAYMPGGRRRRPSERVRSGETVLLVRPRFEEPPAPLHFEVLYEDESMMAVDKPAGLPMHPTATYHRHTLTYLLRERFGERAPRIAHRLDRETSGLVLCAKTAEAERSLKQAFERRAVEKTYLAIVRGPIEPKQGELDWPMRAAPTGLHVLMETCAPATGSPAVTRYAVRALKNHRSLVELRPKTGRQHQLRVHLAHFGHPIVGDKLYGPEGQSAFLEFIDHGMSASLLERLGHHRHALHAHSVELAHPVHGRPMCLDSPLAPDLQELWSIEDRNTA